MRLAAMKHFGIARGQASFWGFREVVPLLVVGRSGGGLHKDKAADSSRAAQDLGQLDGTEDYPIGVIMYRVTLARHASRGALRVFGGPCPKAGEEERGKDRELLGKLEEAGDAAYQVGRSPSKS
ncbi:hypothetical protein Tco_0756689 [Tanacetum coccineum]